MAFLHKKSDKDDDTVKIHRAKVKKRLSPKEENELSVDDLIVSLSPLEYSFGGSLRKFGKKLFIQMTQALSRSLFDYRRHRLTAKLVKRTIRHDEKDLDTNKERKEFSGKDFENNLDTMMKEWIIMTFNNQELDFKQPENICVVLDLVRFYICGAKILYDKIKNLRRFLNDVLFLLAHLFSVEKRTNPIGDGLLVRLHRQNIPSIKDTVVKYHTHLVKLLLFYLLDSYVKGEKALSRREKLQSKSILVGVNEIFGLSPTTFEDFRSYVQKTFPEKSYNCYKYYQIYEKIWNTKLRDEVATEKFGILFEIQEIDVQTVGTTNCHELERRRGEKLKQISEKKLKKEYNEYQRLFAKYKKKVIYSVSKACPMCHQTFSEYIKAKLEDPTCIMSCSHCGILIVGGIIESKNET